MILGSGSIWLWVSLVCKIVILVSLVLEKEHKVVPLIPIDVKPKAVFLTNSLLFCINNTIA